MSQKEWLWLLLLLPKQKIGTKVSLPIMWFLKIAIQFHKSMQKGNLSFINEDSIVQCFICSATFQSQMEVVKEYFEWYMSLHL